MEGNALSKDPESAPKATSTMELHASSLALLSAPTVSNSQETTVSPRLWSVEQECTGMDYCAAEFQMLSVVPKDMSMTERHAFTPARVDPPTTAMMDMSGTELVALQEMESTANPDTIGMEETVSGSQPALDLWEPQLVHPLILWEDPIPFAP